MLVILLLLLGYLRSVLGVCQDKINLELPLPQHYEQQGGIYREAKLFQRNLWRIVSTLNYTLRWSQQDFPMASIREKKIQKFGRISRNLAHRSTIDSKIQIFLEIWVIFEILFFFFFAIFLSCKLQIIFWISQLFFMYLSKSNPPSTMEHVFLAQLFLSDDFY